MALAACAGGLAWGIRGQYGHETGAMIAGVLVGFVLVLLHGRHLTAIQSARSVAMFALGVSIGGSMTYGQTLGLTQDGPLIGNNDAYRWGMLGLAIKGGVWISIGATMFGMGLSRKRYGVIEVTVLIVAMTCALLVGTELLNRPFDPEQRSLPQLYFSDHWHWEPDLSDKPRRECWGGLCAAMAVFLAYVGLIKRDGLAWSLGCWGLLAGAIGFPAGQTIQSYTRWHPEWKNLIPVESIASQINWHNMMETAFGFVFGAIVGLACWLSRKDIAQEEATIERPTVSLTVLVEMLLLAIHVRLLIAWNFQSIPWLDAVADLAIPMTLLPLIVVVGGRFGPFLVSLPVVVLPIAGLTLKQLCFTEDTWPLLIGIDLYVAAPILVATSVAVFLATQTRYQEKAAWFAPIGLVTSTWIFFFLNDAFFHSPWIWEPWTGRTANGFIFSIFAICLTIAATWYAPDLSTEQPGKTTGN